MKHSPSWEANRLSTSQEVPRILRNRRFITAFTSARHLSLSWASSIQSINPHPNFRRFVLILSFNIRLGLPSGFYPSGFPTKSLYTPLLSPYVLHAPPISFFSILSPEKYWVKSSSSCSFLHSPCYLVSLRPKYSPQHPILKNPQPRFLPQCERPSFIPIKNKRQNCISVYPNF